ncbi:polyketide synthase, pelF [Deinococcus grandis]|uniref:Polyketide synthase, pelF n=1 Tax=Deinococcus grandis TaxID=57498 RepID=A0A100HN09_9DEIO|nr:hypothetical protein [Deinococcus grandis]BBN96998.1 hypothetical protein DEGR_37310 [Deinococcus grandis]GAQ23726.1 polyketide synthase, pelF [Deinococcus grandis]
MTKDSEQIRQRLILRTRPGLLIRLIPKRAFTGQLGPLHRPYVCFGDYEEMQGLTVQDAARRLYGGVDDTDPEKYSGYMSSRWRVAWHTETIKSEEGFPEPAYLEDEFYVVTVRTDQEEPLDLFPGTWKALAYLATDHHRMGAAAQVTDQLLNIHGGTRPPLEHYGLSGEDFYLYRDPAEQDRGLDPQAAYYAYVAADSGFANDVLDLFGVDNRCWRGGGYVGAYGEWYARVFLGRNLPLSSPLIHSCVLMHSQDTLPTLL